MRKHIELSEEHIRELPQRVESNYLLYVYFCEKVIDKLLQEKLI